MKTIPILIVVAGLTLAGEILAADQPGSVPGQPNLITQNPTNAPAAGERAVPLTQPRIIVPSNMSPEEARALQLAPAAPPLPGQPAAPLATPTPTNAAETNLAAAVPATTNTPPGNPAAVDSGPTTTGLTNAASTNGTATAPIAYNPKDGLRLNFRNVPLDLVLNYMSDAAGFIIILDTDVRGRVDVWSNQPLTKEEAVSLLDSVLAKNGYAAIRNGRTLTIVARDAAKTQNIPVKKGNKPAEIPKDDEIVTQIIPVRYANALQMTKDLQLLLPTTATMTANESGNALVITDTQSHIRRMAEIVEALDTSISSISIVKVFPLQFADAKDLATAVKELFQVPTGQQQGGGRAQFFARMMMRGGGGGGPGGPGGDMGGGPMGTGDSEARRAASRVVAVADERINALVVSAPDEYIPTIEQLVKDIDINGSDITELRVFHLENADCTEIANIFTQLFPDDTRSNTGQNQNTVGFRFNRGGGRGGGFAASANSQSNSSERMKKKGRVLAVPDQRTSSIIVSAASELMPQIAEMVAQLDLSAARKQKVFVYSLDNAEVQDVEQILRDMFQQNTTQSNNRNRQNQNSALGNRSSQNSQNSSRSGTSGFGGSRGGGMGGGLGGGGVSFP